MDTDLIIVSEYCRKSHIEPSFIVLLSEEGLIEVRQEGGTAYILASQLRELERYTHLYYDLSINIEGIDAIRHLLDRMDVMRGEIIRLQNRLRSFESNDVPEYEV